MEMEPSEQEKPAASENNVAEVLRAFGQEISAIADGDGFQSTVKLVDHNENGQKTLSLFITLRKGILQGRDLQARGLRLC